MGSINGVNKPHAVCIPFPAQGHVNPMMQLAKLLHSRGFHITFVNTEFNHRRLTRSRGPEFATGLPDFSFETIPDGLPPSDRDATQDLPLLCDSVRKNFLAPFKELLLRLKSGTSEVSPVSCIISDGFMSFGIKAAEDLGIPQVELWPASACGFVGFLQFDELCKRGIIPFTVSDNNLNLYVSEGNFMHDGSLDTQIDWIPGMKNIRLKDLPSLIRTQSLDDIIFDFVRSEARNFLCSSAIIFNTFYELEHEVLEAISAMHPNIYTVGPLPLLSQHLPESPLTSLSSSLWKEDSTCLEWLDKREPNSVVYINYGSITTMTEENLKEFAWGLAKSKLYFLWIIRPDVVIGSDSATTLPDKFFEEIKERGLIGKWCPQQQVLSHPSIGVFLTHCGWNSTIESVSAGVPVICWPFFADQQTNCYFACTTWGIGMEMNNDVKSHEVAALVKEMIEGDKGKKLREKAQEWKKKAIEATGIGGSSYCDFDKLIKQALHSNV